MTWSAILFLRSLFLTVSCAGLCPAQWRLIPQNSAALPAKLNASYEQLVVESMPWGGPYDLVVRDGKTGFIFFNIEGYQFDYDANEHLLSVQTGRLLMSKEFAAELGRPSDAGTVVGQISITATMRPIEVTQVVDGEVKSDDLPAIAVPKRKCSGTGRHRRRPVGSGAIRQQQRNAGRPRRGNRLLQLRHGEPELVCQLPDNDHPVIPQNLYRMSGGATNDERFEQIGQSNVKHAFTALTNNICGFGCNGVGGTNLGSGCSDPYAASLNAGPNLGSRAWINPFTGVYPRGDSATPPNSHTGHTHTGPSHRILTEIADLNTSSESRRDLLCRGDSTSRRTNMPGARRIPDSATCTTTSRTAGTTLRHGQSVQLFGRRLDGANQSRPSLPGPELRWSRSNRIPETTASERSPTK